MAARRRLTLDLVAAPVMLLPHYQGRRFGLPHPQTSSHSPSQSGLWIQSENQASQAVRRATQAARRATQAAILTKPRQRSDQVFVLGFVLVLFMGF
nr:hypothetical protein CFP56_05205 [Quercus suber]